MTIIQKIKSELSTHLNQDEKQVTYQVTSSKIPDFDFQTNISFLLSKIRKKKPSDCAEEICSSFKSDSFELTSSGPGFINIKIKDSLFDDILQSLDSFAIPRKAVKTKVIVDYSSPNIAKEFHVGHLRSTIIGHCLANVLEWMGYEVLRLNHIGDWGTAFGMLIAHIKEHYLDQVLNRGDFDLSDLMRWYRESKKRLDNDESFYELSKKEVVLLQGSDSQNLKIWQLICQKSQEAYEKIYTRLGIDKLTVRGESFYNPMLEQVVKDFEQAGHLSKDGGAGCIFMDGFLNRDNQPLPLIIQKSDGGFNYATTDLAALKHRVSVEKASEIYYVTDSGQKEHFKMIFQAATLGGYISSKQHVHHVPFGLVLDKNKKKFKTRSGDTIKLTDLLDEGVSRAYEIALDKDIACPKKFAEIVGIGAIKYADLSNNKINDYVFDFDRMLSFEGNTIVYILYAFVRVVSLKNKLGYDHTKVINVVNQTHHSYNSHEKKLLVSISSFHQVMERLASDQCPHYLTEYLYELSNDFHSFFQHCQVKDHPESQKRLWIANNVASVLKMGLEILGCDVLYEM